MSNQRTCFTCGNTFFSSYGTKCSACQQTDRLSKQFEQNRQNEAQVRLQQERMHEQQLEQNQQIAALNALLSERNTAAIERQTQAIFEMSIRPKDAFDKGFNYTNAYFGKDNPYDLELEVSEDGVVFGWWDGEPYITPALNEKFFDGVYAFLDTIPRINTEVLRQQAHAAGRENAAGTLLSRFHLNSGFEINSVTIYTDTFDSNFQFELDEETGELKMFYDFPFKEQYLNDAYTQGVNEVYSELNTQEMKDFRLAFEIPKIKQQRQESALAVEHERKKKEREELLSMILGFGILLIPIAAGTAAWFFTSGLVTFILIALIIYFSFSWLT